MKITLLSFLSLLLSISSWSQKNEFTHEMTLWDIEAKIEMLFEGMQKGDSSSVAKLFHRDARLMTTYTDKEGKSVVQEGSLDDFLKAIGSPHDQQWNERISDLKIEFDANLATAWMNYSFYLDETFSHCGVNAFQLVKTEEGWRIIQLIDTRRRSNCN